MSLAKYLLIAAGEDDPVLDIHDIPAFLAHLLARVDWRRDLHFQTRTTIDTLDYSGTGLNEGSKVVIAAAGPAVRELPTALPEAIRLPDDFHDPRWRCRACSSWQARGMTAVRIGQAKDFARPSRPATRSIAFRSLSSSTIASLPHGL